MPTKVGIGVPCSPLAIAPSSTAIAAADLLGHDPEPLGVEAEVDDRASADRLGQVEHRTGAESGSSQLWPNSDSASTASRLRSPATSRRSC